MSAAPRRGPGEAHSGTAAGRGRALRALTPDTPIGSSGLPGASVLRRAGPRLGVQTVRDLLFHLPRRYDDLRELRSARELGALADGEVASARLQVRGIRVERTWRRRVQKTTAELADDTGAIQATWFGRRFIERRLREGQWLVLSGRVKRAGLFVTFDNPEFQPDDGTALLHAGRIVPVYRLTEGLTAVTLRRSMRTALDRLGGYPEYLPDPVLAREDLPRIGDALEAAHYPDDFDLRDAAVRRLAFDELLGVQLGMVARRRARTVLRATPVALDAGTDERIRAAIATAIGRRAGLPARLTEDQSRAMDAVRADLAADVPMLRLLQGDVGSGKTAVAAHALAAVALAGRQGALVAPTDLLARQHAATLRDLVVDLGLPVTLLTGTLRGADASEALARIADGTAGIIVGTHALFQERVSFARLGLVVVDEQHRFGVEQRAALEGKSAGVPHVLLMTATPIPRTLGQVLYADLDVSDLRIPPAGRHPIRTAIRRPDELDALWRFVRDEAALDHRTFVVVPLIDDTGTGDPDEADGSIAAEAEATRLADVLAPLEVGLVHGRMRPAQRESVMGRFRDGDLRVLVGTTVIEVGVDVPEATVMVVEGADRFGLAQLHQLRGRVGRGDTQSYCVLVSDAPDDSVGRARLKAVLRLSDGFALAEADFRLRREGDVLGFAQSGLPALRVASLQRADHRALAVRARRVAESLLGRSGSFERLHPGLRRELETGWLAGACSGEPASGV